MLAARNLARCLSAAIPVAFAFLILTASAPDARACELDRPIVIAGLNWDSNSFHAALAARILRSGFDCRVDISPGTTKPLFKDMMRGNIDITMEVWKDNLPKLWARSQRDGSVVELGVNYPDAVQGWFVPTYLVQGEGARAPDLKSVADLPRYKHLFRDPEELNKGRFYNCMLGWGCEAINSKKLKAYGLTEDFTNFRAVSGARMIDAISKHFERREPFVTYYWGPTWVLGTYDLTMLEEPAYDAEVWRRMSASRNPDTATAYPVSAITIAVSQEFHAVAPQIAAFLAAYHTNSAMISNALAYMNRTGEDADAAARHFLQNRPEVWREWLPAERAAKVAAALE